MLLRFGAQNFFSFKEGIEVSLELGAGCPHNISRGNSTANLLCVKGGNGSGKTNVLRILSFLRYFCCQTFKNLKPADDILVSSFFDNEQPVDIYCEFISDGVRYRYDLSLTRHTVLFEQVTRKIKRPVVLFKREGEQLVSHINEFSALNDVKLRKNASIISTAFHYETACIYPIYNFFNSLISNVAWDGRIDSSRDFKRASAFYVRFPEIFKEAREFIKKSDLGISDIKIKETTDENGNKFYFPVFKHDVEHEGNKWLAYPVQSLGTKTLYNTIYLYIAVLSGGGVFIADEFDIDFHPNLLPTFVRHFDDDEHNKNNAQMVFTTHNTEILNYMSKYRTVLINKESSESFGYRLDEIPGDIIRNDRPIVPLYISGKLGGVPRI